MAMNRADVMALQRGRETDVTVGYHVLDVVAFPDLYGNYSQDWDDMEHVVERLQSLGYRFRLCADNDGYHAWFERAARLIQRPEDPTPDEVYHATDKDSAPLAVCRAALLAVMKIVA